MFPALTPAKKVTIATAPRKVESAKKDSSGDEFSTPVDSIGTGSGASGYMKTPALSSIVMTPGEIMKEGDEGGEKDNILANLVAEIGSTTLAAEKSSAVAALKKHCEGAKLSKEKLTEALESFGVSEPFKVYLLEQLWGEEESKENAGGGGNVGGDGGSSVRDKMAYFRTKLGRGRKKTEAETVEEQAVVDDTPKVQEPEKKEEEAKPKSAMSLKERLAAVKMRSSQAATN